MPQQDKIKYFNFLLENDINFSRDESGNYVALVKVLNPAFYGGGDTNLTPNAPPKKMEPPKKEISTLPKKEDTKLKSGHNASKSIPKNISDKTKYGANTGFSNYSGFSYGGYNKDNSTNSKKRNAHKSSEHFEKEKKSVSKILIFMYLYIYIYSCQKKRF